ncbi:MAG TPA: PEGA domain-containing protein, partial [Desulfobacterales bacterium]|nr:PEGA domain-containing protein [Desulfobacterales bacterium]
MAILAAILTIASCATSSGLLLDLVQNAEGVDQPTEPAEPPEELEGLEIRTDPVGASVWINNRYRGTTPLVINELPSGTYRIRITRDGYHEQLAWLDYPGGPMRYQVTLAPVMGYVQIDVSPRVAEVTLDGRRVPHGISPVPVGSYDVAVSAFGYVQWNGRIEVWENVVSPVSVDLETSPFGILTPRLTRTVVNPDNPGLLGSVEVRFDVTGPGSGTASIFDQQGRSVHREDLPSFTSWSQRWTWRPPSELP